MIKYKAIFIWAAIIAIVIVTIFLGCVFVPIKVIGLSMESTYCDGDIVWINKLNKKFEYGTVVVVKHDGSNIIKRIIALQGDIIKIVDNELYRNGELIVSFDERVWNPVQQNLLKEGECYLLGDNYNDSFDSRMFGAINVKDIIGVVM